MEGQFLTFTLTPYFHHILLEDHQFKVHINRPIVFLTRLASRGGPEADVEGTICSQSNWYFSSKQLSFVAEQFTYKLAALKIQQNVPQFNLQFCYRFNLQSFFFYLITDQNKNRRKILHYWGLPVRARVSQFQQACLQSWLILSCRAVQSTGAGLVVPAPWLPPTRHQYPCC